MAEWYEDFANNSPKSPNIPDPNQTMGQANDPYRIGAPANFTRDYSSLEDFLPSPQQARVGAALDNYWSQYTPAAYNQYGVPVNFGTDSGPTYQQPGYSWDTRISSPIPGWDSNQGMKLPPSGNIGRYIGDSAITSLQTGSDYNNAPSAVVGWPQWWDDQNQLPNWQRNLGR